LINSACFSRTSAFFAVFSALRLFILIISAFSRFESSLDCSSSLSRFLYDELFSSDIPVDFFLVRSINFFEILFLISCASAVSSSFVDDDLPVAANAVSLEERYLWIKIQLKK
jgi:hypothetical protein